MWFSGLFLTRVRSIFDELTEREVVDIDERQYFQQCSSCVFRSKCSGYWKGYIGNLWRQGICSSKKKMVIPFPKNKNDFIEKSKKRFHLCVR